MGGDARGRRKGCAWYVKDDHSLAWWLGVHAGGNKLPVGFDLLKADSYYSMRKQNRID